MPPKPPTAALASVGKGIHSKVYNGLIGVCDKFVPPRCVLSGCIQQGLVIAGLSDLTRPADTISANGCLALGATNLIWTRYALVIIPKNYSLFAVNLFVSLTQLFQLGRACNYKLEQSKLEKATTAEKPALLQQ